VTAEGGAFPPPPTSDISAASKSGMSRTLISPVLCLVLMSSIAAAKEPVRERGVLAEMQSVSCGTMQKSGSTVAGVLLTGAQHTKSHELLCQEYVLKADRVTYRIRPKEEKHPVLLRVGDEAEFRLKKDEMLLRIPETDNKEREYVVVSMIASPEFSTELNKTQHPPKPHGVKLDVNGDSSEKPQAPPVTSPSQAAPLAAAAEAPAIDTSMARDALLKVDSTPAGAEIFIDSASAGHTPATINVRPGSHSVQIALPGYKDWVGAVNAVPGVQQQVTANLSHP
jgi:hypothetical protein